MKYKIRYQDTMTTYLLDETFNTEKEAENFINLMNQQRKFILTLNVSLTF